ncbi:ion transport peptide-like [Pollicipes pollicipes]|uniref:ion transport peptide-like n=1 Tax=Pollicipes pollicipes TaxID=41117 RepID=UPI001884B1D9|nr:ion transport peptide-like [Pollicipes pollicipes]
MQSGLLRCLLAAVLAVVCACLVLPTGQAHPLLSDHLLVRSKRSYLDIQCRGVFNKSVYSKLNAICKDCFELYKDPELHGLCRQDCFGSRYFEGCVEALQLTGQRATFSRWIRTLRGNRFQ